ncbi:MAG: tetratricopeptide repeat protein [Anaerolineales bacterium]|nr:tetratricopeptide repeat protein [Anaerolineales bacterium]
MPPRKKTSTRKPEPQVENNIQIEGSDNVVAAGNKSFAANVKIIFQGGWKPFAVVLAAVAVLLSVILWYVVPRKEIMMTKQFNVAVAEFLTQDANGKKISGNDGNLLSSYISQEIGTQFAAMELEKSISYQVWGPDETGTVAGNTPEKRAAAAEVLAKKINAYILIYGVIVTDGEKSKFQPEFYVNHASFRDASEITGSHEIGRELALTLPFNGIQGAENPALVGRVRALNLITMGLAYYSVDKFDNALTYFQNASEEEDWVGSGREVVYLLIGNAYVRKDSQTQNFSDLPLAEQNYQLALENNADYGRAMIGKANVLYLQAGLDKNNCDLAGFDRASVLLDRALGLSDQPASANIETKVHFYRGQIALLRDACHQTNQDWLAAAQDEFTWVTGQYESRKQSSGGYESLQSLTSHAYARLGYIAYKRGDTDASIGWLEKSVEIASPYYQGFYTSMIGDMYASAGKKDQAVQAYDDAIAIAEKNADSLSLKTYQAKLDALK